MVITSGCQKQPIPRTTCRKFRPLQKLMSEHTISVGALSKAHFKKCCRSVYLMMLPSFIYTGCPKTDIPVDLRTHDIVWSFIWNRFKERYISVHLIKLLSFMYTGVLKVALPVLWSGSSENILCLNLNADGVNTRVRGKRLCNHSATESLDKTNKQTNSVASVRERTIPTAAFQRS
jgi:hypothetical protein